MSDIVLSAGVRQNLLSLQRTAELMAMTQNRLATGKKVNSALDNPLNFFTSQSLNNRASDLNSLLDSIGQAQKTLEAADHGITVAHQAGRGRKIDRQAGAAGPAARLDRLFARSRSPATRPTKRSRTTTAPPSRVANTTPIRSTSTSTAAAPAPSTIPPTASATYAEILAGLQADFATEIDGRGLYRPASTLDHGAAAATISRSMPSMPTSTIVIGAPTANYGPDRRHLQLAPACSTISAPPARH